MEKPEKVIIDGRDYEYVSLQMTISTNSETGDKIEMVSILDKDGARFDVPLRRVYFA